VLPRFLDHALAHFSRGKVAVAAGVTALIVIRGWRLSYCAPEVAVFASASWICSCFRGKTYLAGGEVVSSALATDGTS
jgi:hypothetical protein